MISSEFSHQLNDLSENQNLTFTQEINTKAYQNDLFLDEFTSKYRKTQDNSLDNKFTMDSLCKSFIMKYKNSDLVFEPSILAQQFNAKLRRVYDLTNILDGGGLIQKVEKSAYKWKFQSDDFKESLIQRNDWSSLRNISSELISLFKFGKKGFTCQNIYENLTASRKNRFNPASIKRRIYECCRVFLIAGEIQKVGKCFYNAKFTNKDIQQLAQNAIISESSTLPQESPLNLQNLIQKQKSIQNYADFRRKTEINFEIQLEIDFSERKEIIKKIVNQLKTQKDLQKFIQELTLEYKNRAFSTAEDSVQLKIIEQSEDFNKAGIQKENPFFQDMKKFEDQDSSQQLHRKNIIISSPEHRNGMVLLSTNSNFCSFPSNSMLETFSGFKIPFDIKGK